MNKQQFAKSKKEQQDEDIYKNKTDFSLKLMMENMKSFFHRKVLKTRNIFFQTLPSSQLTSFRLYRIS